MASYCGKCGSKLDEATGLCPNCDAAKIKQRYDKTPEAKAPIRKEKNIDKRAKKKELKARKKAAKKEKRANWSIGKKIRSFFLKLILTVILLAVLAVSVTGTLVYFDIVEVPIISSALERIGIKQETITLSKQQINASYTPNEENVIYEDESKTIGYVNNIILLYVYSDVSASRVSEIAESIGGEIVGEISGVYQYQIQVSPMSKEELEILCSEAMEYEEVKYATTDTVFAVETEDIYIPDDPWRDFFQGLMGTDWNEEEPSGYNWWLEATKVPSAWQYRDYFSSINVGVVDNGFDTSHEDLNINVLNATENNAEDHGTHVAGIIGATNDNKKGITGILDKVNLYGVDAYTYNGNRTSANKLLDAIALCISNDCRVVNLSSGAVYADAINPRSNADHLAWMTVAQLVLLLDAQDDGDDFIIVQSAGNGDENNKGVDAGLYQGYFASITEDVVVEYFEYLAVNGKQLERDISVQDVLDSIIIVGAVDKEQKENAWQLADFSNYGDAITVCAPGVDVFSTVVMGGLDGNYDNDTGTSMAAPIVSGITAMVWSVNPDMSAGEVKNIIQQTADSVVLSRREADDGTYYMINAAKAVETALNYVSERLDDTQPSENNYEMDSAFGKYLAAAAKTTETGSWSEHLTLEADMSIAYESGRVTTKGTLTADADVSNYVEDDLSQMEITGSANMKVMGQTYAWSVEYYDGIARYEYTEPSQRSLSLEIPPDFFDFEASIPEEAILTEEISGNQIRFVLSGEVMTEIGIAAAQQMSGVDDLEYEDVEVIVTLNDSGSINQIVMNFDASIKYQGYDADVTYKILYTFN